MLKTYLFTDRHGRRSTHQYSRDEARECYGDKTVGDLETGQIIRLGDGTQVVDLVAYFDRTQRA